MFLIHINPYADDDKQPEEQFQKFWLFTNLGLAAVLGTFVLFQPTYIPMLTPDHILSSKMAAALVLATIVVTGLASFNLFFISSIKPALELLMVKQCAEKQNETKVGN